MFHIGSIFHFRLSFDASCQIVADSGVPNFCDMCSVSIANNFPHPQKATDCGYHSSGELARSTHWFLRKIKQGSSLPLVEQWEQYVLANHPKFPPISNEQFFSGTWVLAALNKIGRLEVRF